MLFNEPKLLKCVGRPAGACPDAVSVLFNEPKLLKSTTLRRLPVRLRQRFSALQRAEIAEITPSTNARYIVSCFSALQRAEIAEIPDGNAVSRDKDKVSVLFNEPKLLKFYGSGSAVVRGTTFQCSSTSRNC